MGTRLPVASEIQFMLLVCVEGLRDSWAVCDCAAFETSTAKCSDTHKHTHKKNPAETTPCPTVIIHQQN